MEQQILSAKLALMEILGQHKIELSAETRVLENFIYQALKYLAACETIKSFAEQKAIITGQLVPAERAAKGSFSFVLEHNLDADKGLVAPTIQVSGTSGNFHALVIKRQDEPLDGYELQQPLMMLGHQYQIGIATNRIRAHVDLAAEFPTLHTLKTGCKAEGRPILYFLGAARQFPYAESPRASVVKRQTKAINTIFSVIEDCFGENVVIGTGGWAGTKEGSLGVPRIGYLHAVTTKRLILTTMPRVGAYDRHENPTLEVFCGQEWGDDSAVLAAACDAAFIFSPYGTWTQLEVENLLLQKKPFVVIDDPLHSQLNEGETRKTIHAPRGSYFVYASAEDAANDLLQELHKVGFKCSRRSPMSLPNVPHGHSTPT